MGRQALPPPGEARQDLWIIQELATAHGPATGTTSTSARCSTEMARLMPALASITWERVEREHHVTYPCDAAGRARAATWCSTRASRARAAAPSWWRPRSRRRTSRRTHDYPVHAHHRPPARALAHRRHDAARQRARRDRAERRSPRVSRGTIAKLGVKPGDMRSRVTTRRGDGRARRARRTTASRTAWCSSRSPISRRRPTC